MANRIVVFSDIQGNSVALNAMFDWLKKLPDFDRLDFICLGDVACGYAPNAVLDTLREHQVHCVRGNMDDVILKPQAYTGDDDDEKRFNEMDFWASKQLTQINQEFLNKASSSYKVNRFGTKLYFTHGNFFDNESVRKPAPKSGGINFNEDFAVLFTGHWHMQTMNPWSDRVHIMVGSIGFPDSQPGGKRPLRAQFVIVDEGRFEFVTVNYSLADFSFAVMNSGMPHATWYLSFWDI